MLQLAGCDEQPRPLVHIESGHTLAWPQLWGPSHVTSHAQASWQSTAPHELVPEHVT